MRLFLDEDIHLSLGSALRKRGIDAIHAQEQDRKGLLDKEQLAYAVGKKRCLYSFNVKDFVLLHNFYIEREMTHYGIVVSQQLPIGESLRRLLNIM